jgi:hypothetical protein
MAGIDIALPALVLDMPPAYQSAENISPPAIGQNTWLAGSPDMRRRIAEPFFLFPVAPVAFAARKRTPVSVVHIRDCSY